MFKSCNSSVSAPMEGPQRLGVALGVGGSLAVLLTALPVWAQLGSNAEADQAYLDRVVNRVLESERSNTPVAWSHGETGSRGSVTVERTFYLDRDTPCRDYAWSLEQADGTRVNGRGTGCRSGRGTWELDEEPPVVASRPPPEPTSPATVAEPECSCPAPPAAAAEAEPEGPAFTDYTLPAKAGI